MYSFDSTPLLPWQLYGSCRQCSQKMDLILSDVSAKEVLKYFVIMQR